MLSVPRLEALLVLQGRVRFSGSVLLCPSHEPLSVSSIFQHIHYFLKESFSAKKYTKDHEAIKFDDSNGVGTVTITDYAQQSLGDVVFVELPSVGTKVAAGGWLKHNMHLQNLNLFQIK